MGEGEWKLNLYKSLKLSLINNFRQKGKTYSVSPGLWKEITIIIFNRGCFLCRTFYMWRQRISFFLAPQGAPIVMMCHY